MKNTLRLPALLLLLILGILSVPSTAQNFWQPTNGPQGGIYRDISTNYSNGMTYLVTHWHRLKGNGLGSNMFVTADDGITWSEIDNGLGAVPIYGLAHNNVNSSIVISTMNAASPLNPANFNAIYFSNNNGTNWTQMNSTEFVGNLPPVTLLFNSTADTIFTGQKTQGVKYSFDDGATWSTMNTGITNHNITDLEYGYQGALYACTDSVAGNGGKIFVKNGTSWTNVSAGLGTSRINDLHYDNLTSTMYLGTANFSSGSGKVYKSVNGGPWTIISGYPGVEVAEINTTANGDPIVRVANLGVWRYSVGAWLQVSTNLNTQITSSITRDSNGDVLLTTLGGIWKLDDLTNSWSYFTASALKNSQGRSMAFSENGDLIVGTDNGMYKSPDGGNSWTHTGITDEPMMSTILYAPDGRMFAGNSDNVASFVYTSTDDGSSWNPTSTGFSSFRTCDFAYNSSGEIFVGSGWSKPMHSSTDGVNWTGAPWATSGFSANTVSIAVAIDATDAIYIGTESQGVLKSTDNGVSYSWIGFTGGDVTDIQISPNQDVFVAHDAFTGGGNGSLYRSTDGGASWSSSLMTTNGLTNCIFIASVDSIYVGTSSGVWFSSDTANTWTLLTSGLNPGNVVIHTLELGPDGYLYAGTAGNGIYRSVDQIKYSTTTTSVNELSKTETLLYPNPTNQVLNFSQTLTDFEVYNIYGQVVIPKIQSANSIDTEGLTDGIYFIRSNDTVLKFIVKH